MWGSQCVIFPQQPHFTQKLRKLFSLSDFFYSAYSSNYLSAMMPMCKASVPDIYQEITEL